MRRRKLRKLVNRLEEIRDMKRIDHKELLMKLGAARKEAGIAWRLMDITTPVRASGGQVSGRVGRVSVLSFFPFCLLF
ncbi:MAG: hypothetical protein JXR40_11290 [Pontiellaceae bacterium]|nr:hypothetical protein [Pontiellaceae bacterium]